MYYKTVLSYAVVIRLLCTVQTDAVRAESPSRNILLLSIKGFLPLLCFPNQTAAHGTPRALHLRTTYSCLQDITQR
jgi:hypothetical protein